MKNFSNFSKTIIAFIMGVYCSYVLLIHPYKISTCILIGIPFFIIIVTVVYILERMIKNNY